MRAFVAGIAALFTPFVLGAQGFRVTGTSLANYVELRPVVGDSIADSLAIGSGIVRESPVGLVSCPAGQTRCYFYRSLPRAHTLPVTQDLEITGWGLGEGVSVYTHVRGNATAAGATELWTRGNDRFTALAASIEIDRTRWNARAGRQWLASMLGVTNFDGLSARISARENLRVNGYIGSSLIQGLSEPTTGAALAATDVLPPDVGGILLGASAQWRTTDALSLGAEYQRELRRDRAGLFSERVALDGAFLLGRTTITGEAQADLSATTFNELRLRASRAVLPGVLATLEARHSTPFFPLWTIWGVFAPVGFNEARANLSWGSAERATSVTVGGSYRRYQETHTGVGFLPLRNDGWTVVASGSWRWKPAWEATANYRRDIGFGASKSDAIGGVRWQPRDDAWLGITGSAVQNIFEYRVAGSYLLGTALDGSVALSPVIRVTAQAGVFRQMASNEPATTVNWSQRRAFVRVEWAAGRDPGMRGSP